jgi:RNA polymerase sigma-70 factor (ECF subfamily)
MTPDACFRDQMLSTLPNLRAFALSLARDSGQADDLVQETILRAWSKAHLFKPGTNLSAWLFTILRNLFYSDLRKQKRQVPDSDQFYAGRLRTCHDQIAHLEWEEFRVALARLQPDQREALILIGAEGLSYEEAARICGTPIGTIKSRVNRARTRLAELLQMESKAAFGPDSLTKAVLETAARL